MSESGQAQSDTRFFRQAQSKFHERDIRSSGLVDRNRSGDRYDIPQNVPLLLSDLVRVTHFRIGVWFKVGTSNGIEAFL